MILYIIAMGWGKRSGLLQWWRKCASWLHPKKTGFTKSSERNWCSSMQLGPTAAWKCIIHYLVCSTMPVMLGNIFCMQVWEKENCCTICCCAVDTATQIFCLTPGAQLFTILVHFLHFLL
jgi:hypothetical protein